MSRASNESRTTSPFRTANNVTIDTCEHITVVHKNEGQHDSSEARDGQATASQNAPTACQTAPQCRRTR